MMIREEFISRLKNYGFNFVPTIRPACANFVSRAIKSILDLEFPEINRVPELKDALKKNHPIILPRDNVQVKPGDIIVYDRTYNALPPYDGEPGPEDDMTHIGFVFEDNGGYDILQMDFSNSQDRAIIRNVKELHTSTRWYINSFIDMSKYFSDKKESYSVIKIFIHGKEVDVLKDGKSILGSVYVDFTMKIKE